MEAAVVSPHLPQMGTSGDETPLERLLHFIRCLRPVSGDPHPQATAERQPGGPEGGRQAPRGQPGQWWAPPHGAAGPGSPAPGWEAVVAVNKTSPHWKGEAPSAAAVPGCRSGL